MTRRRTGSLLTSGLIAVAIVAATCAPALADSSSSTVMISSSSNGGSSSSFVTIFQSASSTTSARPTKRVRTKAAALARARRLLERVSSLAGALSIAGSEPQVATTVCPVLSTVRAMVLAQLNSLIARFPQVAGHLTDIRDLVVGIVDRYRTALGCA